MENCHGLNGLGIDKTNALLPGLDVDDVQRRQHLDSRMRGEEYSRPLGM